MSTQWDDRERRLHPTRSVCPYQSQATIVIIRERGEGEGKMDERSREEYTLLLARATTENASLISQKSIFACSMPAFLRAFGMAREGVVGNCIGSCSASAKPS